MHGLARIKDLGFNAIWVTPPFVNQVSQGDSAGYHGYWGLDFTRVDPHLGTNQDFADFVVLRAQPRHEGDPRRRVRTTRATSSSRAAARRTATLPVPRLPRQGLQAGGVRRQVDVPVPEGVDDAAAADHLPGPSQNAKKPDWLNDPTNYHNRGDIDFSSCSSACYQQGDVFGLDDLFTEKPAVVNGLVQIYSDWITKYKLDGFRVDTARHLNPGFWKLWVPKMLAAAKSVGVNDFQIFGEAPITDSVELSTYVRDTRAAERARLPLPGRARRATRPAARARSRCCTGCRTTTTSARPNGIDPTPPTFLGNHDMGRAAMQIRQQGGGLTGDALLQRVLLGYDLLYLLRGAPVVYYGDEVGMIGSGGDKAARAGHVPDAGAGLADARSASARRRSARARRST